MSTREFNVRNLQRNLALHGKTTNLTNEMVQPAKDNKKFDNFKILPDMKLEATRKNLEQYKKNDPEKYHKLVAKLGKDHFDKMIKEGKVRYLNGKWKKTMLFKGCGLKDVDDTFGWSEPVMAKK